MKQTKSNKYSLTKNTLILLFISIQNTIGLTKQHNTYIQIYSHAQHIDITTNTLIMTGNVVIQKNYDNIYADKIIIRYQYNNHQIIDAYGNPVIFYQSKNNKKQILATSLHMSYQTLENTIILKGKAILKESNYTLQSDCIKYTANSKHIETCNKKNIIKKTILTYKKNINAHIPIIQSYNTYNINKNN